jgi:acyl-coenzyme A synthetase/AMP-(fatty) acid ligase
VRSLWDFVADAAPAPCGSILDPTSHVELRSLARQTAVHGGVEPLRGRSVLVAVRGQWAAALACLELDGVARRLVLCTPELTEAQLRDVASVAQAQVVLVDAPRPGEANDVRFGEVPALHVVRCGAPLTPTDAIRRTTETTEWVLLTSGTSGTPKLVAHTLATLSGAVPARTRQTELNVWSTFYDRLVRAYPSASVAHAFASTEAGVAFDVDDGRAGFPQDWLDQERAGVALKVEDGTLRIRSPRTASRYLGAGVAAIRGPHDWVDTGDRIECSNGRCHFAGRAGGVINVGGLKVHPEEVEAVLNADPRVRLSRVRARKNPITGAIVVAEVVLVAAHDAGAAPAAVPSDAGQAAVPTGADTTNDVHRDLIEACRRSLAAHKVPVVLQFVPTLALTAAGKLVRPGA